LKRFLSWFSRKPEVQPPCQPVYWTLQAVYLARAYYVSAELKIADLLEEGPCTCEELAEATGTHERSLFRILRALASFGVFAQNEWGQFETTEAARTLRSDVAGSLRDWTILTGTMPTWQAFGHALDMVRTGKNGHREQMLWLDGALRTTQEWNALLDQSGFRRTFARPTAIVDAVILECEKVT
jgi:hypothetical protein